MCHGLTSRLLCPAVAQPVPAVKSGGVVHWWRSKFSSKKSRKSLPACTTLHSVPEDSLATPSKAHDIAMPRLGDLDSAEDGPKITAGRLGSYTQSSAQLSGLMTANSMLDAPTGLQSQDTSAQPERAGSIAAGGAPMHRRGHSTGSMHYRQPSGGSVVDLGKAFDCILAAAPSKGDQA